MLAVDFTFQGFHTNFIEDVKIITLNQFLDWLGIRLRSICTLHVHRDITTEIQDLKYRIDQLVGMDEPRRKLTNLLIRDEQQCWVISVLGMGGHGKNYSKFKRNDVRYDLWIFGFAINLDTDTGICQSGFLGSESINCQGDANFASNAGDSIRVPDIEGKIKQLDLDRSRKDGKTIKLNESSMKINAEKLQSSIVVKVFGNNALVFVIARELPRQWNLV
ncbi:hypothetical protein KFK09_006945 [Dendrobium nobile]|uniref:Uncharacterized protein n=1 Tax=Dendrobium nobile TaxID=94219 RepID=A0A8T3BTU0_DENNO|nr:hypothetical protein KFK09_006945 [Dendrobium nobile]